MPSGRVNFRAENSGVGTIKRARASSKTFKSSHFKVIIILVTNYLGVGLNSMVKGGYTLRYPDEARSDSKGLA